MQCKANVAAYTSMFRWRACERNAVRDGYCAQHHPDAVAARKAKREAAREAKRAEWRESIERPRKAHQKALEALQRAEAALLRGQCENALAAVLEARRAIEGRA